MYQERSWLNFKENQGKFASAIKQLANYEKYHWFAGRIARLKVSTSHTCVALYDSTLFNSRFCRTTGKCIELVLNLVRLIAVGFSRRKNVQVKKINRRKSTGKLLGMFRVLFVPRLVCGFAGTCSQDTTYVATCRIDTKKLFPWEMR